ncbi:unnamed protein product [Sphagnum jensenii]|uniref:Uncharacterized protein n=1 Tax=Sphagnum jensenii TaxID=128206 RepID=A0ABP0WZ57_9BRYO
MLPVIGILISVLVFEAATILSTSMCVNSGNHRHLEKTHRRKRRRHRRHRGRGLAPGYLGALGGEVGYAKLIAKLTVQHLEWTMDLMNVVN